MAPQALLRLDPMARNHPAFSPTCAAVLLGALRTMLCARSSQYPHRLLTSLFLFQLPNPLLQELPLWFLLGQRQSFLISGPSLSCPAEPAVHIRTG